MIDLYTKKMTSTPQAFADYLLAQGPVFWSEPEKFWVITDHGLATSVLKSTDFSADRSAFFMSRLEGLDLSKVGNFFGVVKKMMVSSDPPLHTARRRLANSGINDHVLDGFAPKVKLAVGSLLAECRPGSKIDFLEQIAQPLPNIVLADLFSIPPPERPNFYKWSNHMTQFFGGASQTIEVDADNADSGAAHLRDYFAQLIVERKKNPQDDFLSHLVKAQGDLDNEEVISQAAIMLVAGIVTTTDQICNNLYSFLRYEIWPQLVENPALLTAAIEEATRLDPSVNFLFRVATKNLQLGTASVTAGQLVFISNHAVNRNPAVFERQNEFVLERPKNPHLAYGSGIHYCLGARLGRIIMHTLFTEMLEKFPQIQFTAKEPQRKHQSLAFSGFEEFQLTLGNK